MASQHNRKSMSSELSVLSGPLFRWPHIFSNSSCMGGGGEGGIYRDMR